MATKLKDEIILLIKKKNTLKLELMLVLDVSHTTMYKYLKENDPKLIQLDVLNKLAEKTNIKVKDLTCTN